MKSRSGNIGESDQILIDEKKYRYNKILILPLDKVSRNLRETKPPFFKLLG